MPFVLLSVTVITDYFDKGQNPKNAFGFSKAFRRVTTVFSEVFLCLKNETTIRSITKSSAECG